MSNTVNFGTCWGTPNGQDLSTPSYMASGFLVVAESILRIWSTPQGQLIDDPDYGYDLNDLISDDLSPSQLLQAQQLASAAAQKDERVLGCAVVLTLLVTGTLTVNARVDTAAGPFQMVVSVSQAGVVLTQMSQ
jgi:phage baseplate assembly protein W